MLEIYFIDCNKITKTMLRATCVKMQELDSMCISLLICQYADTYKNKKPSCR